MGNCPSGYVKSPSAPFACVVGCPENRGLALRNIAGESYCVYNDRPEVKLLLKNVTAFQGESAPTMEEIERRIPSVYAEYKAAKDDFEKKLPLVLSQVEKEQQLKDAFVAMQTAENVRDQSPQGYQDARNRYYTLLRGDAWVNEESQRIAAAEVVPKITQYTQIKADLTNRLTQQQQTIDVVNSVKDKVLSMKDDFAYTTNTFSKQISDLKNQINIERKNSQKEKAEVISWMDMILNIIITILLIGLVVVIIRKLVSKRATNPSSAYTSTPRY